MKIRIEINEAIEENEVIIKCKKIDSNISALEEAIKNISKEKIKLVFLKDNKEYYLLFDDILFFETELNTTYAHTNNDAYIVKNKLYELEEILPKNFIRISKSTIVNVDCIFSIEKNITSSSLIQFSKSHKQVYASRFYYKELRNKLEERRNL